MSTCPACGVAVVPGYVKCPKCGTVLPRTRAGATKSPSGTVLEESQDKGSSVWLIVGISVVLAVGVGFVLSRTNSSHTAKADTKTETVEPVTTPQTVQTPTTPLPSQTFDTTTTTPTGPTPQAVANEIDGQLKKQRLWGTVTVAGDRIDIRSGSCDDRAMVSVVDAKVAQLHAAGLTKLRCLSQSGGVVFERNL